MSDQKAEPQGQPLDHPPESCRHFSVNLLLLGMSQAEATELYGKIVPLLPTSKDRPQIFSMMVVEHVDPVMADHLVLMSRARAARYVAMGAEAEMSGTAAQAVKDAGDRLRTSGTN